MILNHEVSEPTMLSELISDAMVRQDISIKQLRTRLRTDADFQLSYEHLRRLVRGIGNATRPVLKAVAEVLKLSFDELETAAKLDGARKKGIDEVVLEAAGKDPSLAPMARVWKRLTEDQRMTVLNLASDMARRNKV